jgi:hypothetical protein
MAGGGPAAPAQALLPAPQRRPVPLPDLASLARCASRSGLRASLVLVDAAGQRLVVSEKGQRPALCLRLLTRVKQFDPYRQMRVE